MTTMNEIKKMTAEELADFLIGDAYEGCEDGLFFVTDIEGCVIKYTLGLDDKGIVAGALRLGLLDEEEIGDPDDLTEDELKDLAIDVYNWDNDEKIDRNAIEFMRDEIIEDLEKELEEIKKWED